MKKIIFIITLTAICCKGYSQYNKYWAFGDSAGIIFEEDGSITSFNTGMAGFESSAIISDSVGNLLFYTNGESIWNKEHEIMENGNDLDIGQVYLSEYGSSITQGVIIIPVPQNINKYYIFYIAYEFFPVEILGLRYAVVDMSLEDGLGEVVSKNLSIYDSITCEKLQAVKHANGRDWWLLARQQPYSLEGINEIQFIRFLITPYGIEGPYYQHYGPANEWTDNNYGFGGEMVFSCRGDKLAYTGGPNLDIYDFDRCTGELSNVETIYDIDNLLIYGCAFSPDGNKIYVSTYQSTDLYQYCLNCKEEIDSTKTLLYHLSGYYDIGQLELASDDKIYFTTSYTEIPNDVFNTKTKYLSVINHPNLEGLACDIDTNTIYLGGSRAMAGLPNMPNYNLGALTGSECDTLSTALHTINKKDAISIYPNPASTSFIISGDISFGDEVVMYNATGQLLLQEKIIANQLIDISGIVSGIYHLQIRRDGEIIYRDKLIVMSGEEK